MRKPTVLLLVLSTLTIQFCDGYHILVVFPFPGKSHALLGEAFVRLLLKAGHEVTYITPFPKNSTNPKLHEIDVSENIKLYPADRVNLRSILTKEIVVNDKNQFFDILNKLNYATFENENVAKLMMDTNQKIDVVIIEWMLTEATVGFSEVFDCPYIYFASTDISSPILSLIDESVNPALLPNSLSKNIPPLDFIQRVKELFMKTGFWFFKEILIYKPDLKAYEKGFTAALAKRGKQLPPFNEVRHNASLLLVNSHVSFGSAVRLPQNCKHIGGYHIDPDIKQLPDDLKRIMDNAKDGVIYFSMGSNLKSKDLPNELKEKLLKAFGNLKYTVIWKFEEKLPNTPKNVHILQWAPQTSILAHPNCKLFITHGGLLSSTETVYFGVPIIGIPVFADQFLNVDRSVKRGFAQHVDLSLDLADDLTKAINEVMSNPSYTQKAKELQTIFHDRLVTPGEEAVFWIEHVVRTRGALYMRSPALMLSWYQRIYLDFISLLLLFIFLIVFVIKRLCCRKTVSKKKKE